MDNSLTRKKVLIPGGKTSDQALVEAAHELGLFVITSGNDTSAPAHKVSDKYICADYSNRELMLEIATTEQVDYMCSSANDIALVSTSYVCEKLGLPGHDSYETTITLHHKDRFKEMAQKLNLHVPEGEGFDDEDKALSYAMSKDYPVIIKPVDLVGGNGISKAITKEEKEAGIRKAFDSSLKKHIVIERFINGTSHSFATFIINKRVVAYYSDNEYTFYGAFKMSTSSAPATNISSIAPIVIEDAEKVAQYLNLVDGRLHIQYILEDGIPYILEMTRRACGDLFSIPASKALGIDTSKWIVKAECGFDLSDFPAGVKQTGFHGKHCIVAPRNGKIRNVTIDPALSKYVYKELSWWKPGYEITNWLVECVGLLFYSFDSEENMLEIVPHIIDYIHFDFY